MPAVGVTVVCLHRRSAALFDMLESIAADECLDIEQVQVKFANLVQLQVMDVISIPFRDR